MRVEFVGYIITGFLTNYILSLWRNADTRNCGTKKYDAHMYGEDITDLIKWEKSTKW